MTNGQDLKNWAVYPPPPPFLKIQCNSSRAYCQYAKRKLNSLSPFYSQALYLDSPYIFLYLYMILLMRILWCIKAQYSLLDDSLCSCHLSCTRWYRGTVQSCELVLCDLSTWSVLPMWLVKRFAPAPQTIRCGTTPLATFSHQFSRAWRRLRRWLRSAPLFSSSVGQRKAREENAACARVPEKAQKTGVVRSLIGSLYCLRFVIASLWVLREPNQTDLNLQRWYFTWIGRQQYHVLRSYCLVLLSRNRLRDAFVRHLGESSKVGSLFWND